jgi:hypothetical protein
LRGSPARAGHPSDRSPRLVRGPKPVFSTVFRGTFLHYCSFFRLSTSRCPDRLLCTQQSRRQVRCWKTFRRGVRLGSPDSRELGDIRRSRTGTAFDERRKRTSILRAGGGSVNPRCHCSRAISLLSGDLDPGARHATTASHTVGQWLQTPLDYDLGTWMSTDRH